MRREQPEEDAVWRRWQGWSVAALVSLVLWVLIIAAVSALFAGCAARVGEGGSITYTERVKVDRPPKEVDPVCPAGEPMRCCCDLSREGVISCRCPHPGGPQ